MSSIVYIGETVRNDNWKCFHWLFSLNGVVFDYYTGLGHSTNYHYSNENRRPKDKKTLIDNVNKRWIHIPNSDEVLHSLFLDSHCGELPFDDFCDEFGYDSNRIKSFEIYNSCCKTKRRLREALGPNWETERKRIEELEL